MDDRSDIEAIHNDLERARATIHTLVATTTSADLRRPTDGTRWTNQQMLFHMVFGYLVVLRLLPLVRLFGRLPDRYSKTFARVLNAGTRPFHTVNYLGSCGGALVFHDPRLVRLCDRVIDALHRHLDHDTESTMSRTMHFPVGWDPYFRDTMSLADVYRFGTQHFDAHARQLTLTTDPPTAWLVGESTDGPRIAAARAPEQTRRHATRDIRSRCDLRHPYPVIPDGLYTFSTWMTTRSTSPSTAWNRSPPYSPRSLS